MCEEQKKDFSLLRPFDLEKVKAGDPVCYKSGEGLVQYLGGPDVIDKIAYLNQNQNRIFTDHISRFRMAPLCWVEGRPVYSGDWLHYKITPQSGQVVRRDGDLLVIVSGGFYYRSQVTAVTWTQPKVKREGWVNIYPKSISNETIAILSNVYASKEAANCEASPNRITCVHIEWEE